MQLAKEYKISKTQILNTWYLDDILDAMEYNSIQAEFEKYQYANIDSERKK